jgi:hypothetical protein
MPMPLCNVKLVNVTNGKSIAPLFQLFTDVPIPGKWKGYIIDDLTLSTDPASLNYGEKGGVPNSPIGIYDFTNRLVTTIDSDPNGVFEVLLPSTYSMAYLATEASKAVSMSIVSSSPSRLKCRSSSLPLSPHSRILNGCTVLSSQFVISSEPSSRSS